MIKKLLLDKPGNTYVWLVLILALLGTLMVFSSSSYYAEHFAKQCNGDSWYYFKRQIAWLVIGLIGGGGAYLLGYRRILRLSPYILLVSVILLVVVMFFKPIKDVHRWIRIGSISFQPSEFAKMAILLFMSSELSKEFRRASESARFISILVVVGIVCGLILIGPDLGSALALGMSLGILMYLAGIKKSYLLMTGIASLVVVIIIIFGFGYKKNRIEGYISGLENPLESPYQVKQGLTAIGSSGVLGKGLGSGRQKMLFLPEPHTDFIFANIAEETGFLGTIPLISVYLLLFYIAEKIASRCKDPAGRLLVWGLSVAITLTSFINIAVVLGILPVTGLPLPFISYGGSSLFFNMVAAALVASVAFSGGKAFSWEIKPIGGYHNSRRRYRRPSVSGTGNRQKPNKHIGGY